MRRARLQAKLKVRNEKENGGGDERRRQHVGKVGEHESERVVGFVAALAEEKVAVFRDYDVSAKNSKVK